MRVLIVTLPVMQAMQVALKRHHFRTFWSGIKVILGLDQINVETDILVGHCYQNMAVRVTLKRI
jgi:hypothetical protein